MSERDKQLLKCSNITVVRAAHILSLSRQALHDGLRDARHYLDEAKLARIYLALTSTRDIGDAVKAAALYASIKDARMSIDALVEDQQPPSNQHDYYCIFSKAPLELREPTYLSQRMVKEIYPEVRLFAYFVGSESVGKTLYQAIMRKRTGAPWRAAIYIIESSLARCLPHISLYRRTSGYWEGQVFSFDRSGEHEPMIHALPVDEEYVMNLKLILEDAGFRLDIDDNPEDFIENGQQKNGEFSFKLLYVIKGDQV